MAESELSDVKRGGGWMVFLGVLMILGGIGAMLAPLAAGAAIVWIIGGVLLFVGLMSFLSAFQRQSFWPGAGDFLMGLLYVAIGVGLWMRPLAGLASLGLIVAIFLFVRGVMQVAVSFQLKPAKGWGWVLFSGVVAVLLGVLLLVKWPLAGMWAIGVFLGIELFVSGWTMVFAGGTLRDAVKEARSRGGAASA